MEFTKKCSKCKEDKPISEFPIRKDTLQLRGDCKDCRTTHMKQYYKKNASTILQKSKQYYKKNFVKCKQRAKQYRRENVEEIRKRKKLYYLRNSNKIIQNSIKYCKHRLKVDSLFKLKINIMALIRASFRYRNYKKTSKTVKILGCSIEHFKKYLEKQFKPGMTWENRNKWHIDHIVPVSLAKTKKELLKLNHYTNLQPLWAEENLKKGAKLNYGSEIGPNNRN